MILSRLVQCCILGTFLAVCGGCQSVQKEQYGDLTVWNYTWDRRFFGAVREVKVEFPDVRLDSKSPQYFDIKGDDVEFVPIPTRLLFPVSNLGEFVDPQTLQIKPLEVVNVELTRDLPFSEIVLSVQTLRDGIKLRETIVDFSKGNWYLILTESHRGFATKPAVLEPLLSYEPPLPYNRVRIEVIRAPDTPGLRARFVAASETSVAFRIMKTHDNGVDHVLYRLPDHYTPSGRKRPRAWPPRW